MTLSELYRQTRDVLGNPDVNEVPNSRLDMPIDRALNWLAARLKFERHTEEQEIALVAGQRTYSLRNDLAYIVWGEWNQVKLRQKSVYEYDRDSVDYRHESPAPPQEFAVSGRTLILRPMPGTAEIITDPFFHYRGIFSVSNHPEAGLPTLGEFEYQLLVYQAALEYLSSRPSDENTVRIQFCQKRIDELLPSAQARAASMLDEFYPRWRPESLRLGGAR